MSETQSFFDAYDLLLFMIGAALLLITLAKRFLERFNLSHTLLYLTVGLVAGPLLLDLAPRDPLEAVGVLERVTEFAVIMSLIVIGIRIGRPISWKGWQSTVRLIGIVMPATMLLVALTGWWILGLALGPAILLGAILAPTDPIMAGALEEHDLKDEREDRFGLSSEAGLNDGFAFPFVYLGLNATLHLSEWRVWLPQWFLKDLLYGVALALPLGWFLGHLCGRAYVRGLRHEAVSQKRHEFIPFGLLLAAYGLAEATGVYGFLAAFTAGLGLRRALQEEEALEQFATFTDAVDGLMKGLVLIMVGALLRWEAFADVGWPLLGFALLLIVLLRPGVTYLATAGGGFRRVNRLYWSWFGIRGIGSLYYMSYALGQDLAEPVARALFTITLGTVVVSGVLHGLSLRPFMQAFEGGEEVEE